MTAEAITSFQHFSLGQVSILNPGALCCRKLSQSWHTRWNYHAKVYLNNSYDVLSNDGVEVGVRLRFLLLMFENEFGPKRNSLLVPRQDGRYYLVGISQRKEKVIFLLTLGKINHSSPEGTMIYICVETRLKFPLHLSFLNNMLCFSSTSLHFWSPSRCISCW